MTKLTFPWGCMAFCSRSRRPLSTGLFTDWRIIVHIHVATIEWFCKTLTCRELSKFMKYVVDQTWGYPQTRPWPNRVHFCKENASSSTDCPEDYFELLKQAFKFDLFSTTCVSRLVEPLSFFLEFCYKAGNFEELNEFLSKKFEFIEGSVVFSV